MSAKLAGKGGVAAPCRGCGCLPHPTPQAGAINEDYSTSTKNSHAEPREQKPEKLVENVEKTTGINEHIEKTNTMRNYELVSMGEGTGRQASEAASVGEYTPHMSCTFAADDGDKTSDCNEKGTKSNEGGGGGSPSYIEGGGIQPPSKEGVSKLYRKRGSPSSIERGGLQAPSKEGVSKLQ